MSTNIDVFAAVVDAIIADPTINQGAAQDAARTVATLGVTNAEAQTWLNELEALYQSIGIIGNATWAPFRNKIAGDGKPVSVALFTALRGSVNQLPGDAPISLSVRKLELRAERDIADANIDRLIVIRDAESAQQVKDAINLGIAELRGYKQRVIQELQSAGDV